MGLRSQLKEIIMKSVDSSMIIAAQPAEIPEKKRRPDAEFSVVAVVILTGLMLWTGLLLFSVPGVLDAVAVVLAIPW
jgi:hypothetical protein